MSRKNRSSILPSGKRFGELVESVNAHIQEEEEDLFPKIQNSCNSEELERIGSKLEQMRTEARQKAA